MLKIIRFTLLAAVGLMQLVLLAGCANVVGVVTATNTPQYLGKERTYAISTPTVVFEHGADQDGKGTWSELTRQVSAFAPTIAFSRTGWGEALFGDIPYARTPSLGAVSLRQNLQQAGAKPPYILVAHSIGSYYVLNFARQWPSEVAGIVLVDGRLNEFTALCQKNQGNLCDPAENLLLLALMPAAGRAEILGEKQGRNEIPDPKELGGIPITLLYNTRKEFPHNDGFIRAWIESQENFNGSLQNGRSIPVNGGHFIHHTYPELVRDTIKKHVEEARLRTAH